MNSTVAQKAREELESLLPAAIEAVRNALLPGRAPRNVMATLAAAKMVLAVNGISIEQTQQASNDGAPSVQLVLMRAGEQALLEQGKPIEGIDLAARIRR